MEPKGMDPNGMDQGENVLDGHMSDIREQDMDSDVEMVN